MQNLSSETTCGVIVDINLLPLTKFNSTNQVSLKIRDLKMAVCGFVKEALKFV